MIKYFFSFDSKKHLVHVRLNIDEISETKLDLNLPAWRAGRYQLQNFAKNILNFYAENNQGEPLVWRKTEKNVWSIDTRNSNQVSVSYSYYAVEFNAGGSVVKTDLVYINPVNLTLFDVEYTKPFEVELHFVNDGELAIGLDFYKKNDNDYLLKPNSWYEWFDSPFVYSNSLFYETFKVKNYDFHFWMYGESQIFLPAVIQDIQRFTEYQVELFGVFPESNYHFILLVPDMTYYHGVEHAKSTVMVLGENGVLPNSYYYDLMGLASHELFHAWNIAKIRPKELLNYDFTKENYFETCFVAEGFTTYYGDLVLYKSGVMDWPMYKKELESTLKRHFDESDYACQSLLESSFDLWVDGYEKGTPGKKVSVYNKGAVAAMLLDYLIKSRTNGQKSLDDIMLLLWQNYGDLKKGYTYQEIIEISEQVYGGSLKSFFEKVIAGSEPIFDYTNSIISNYELKMEKDIQTGLVRLI